MRVYKFRIYPNKEQETVLFDQFDYCSLCIDRDTNAADNNFDNCFGTRQCGDNQKIVVDETKSHKPQPKQELGYE